MTKLATRVLIVDDDVDACHNLADILGDVGYNVSCAHDATEALELMERQPFDVALLDFKLPGMDGLDLYREIRRRFSDTVAMIITAYASAETASEALDAGAWRVLPKPIDISQLLPLVEEAGGQPLVMVVDDDPALCENLWSLLRDRGFRVGIAQTRDEADQHLKRRDYKVVLIDMRLPGCDGSDIYRIVRRHAADARTVMITGYRSEAADLIDALMKEGADAVCYKPFEVAALLETVARLTETPSEPT